MHVRGTMFSMNAFGRCVLAASLTLSASAQFQPAQQPPNADVLDRALQLSSLTRGGHPFHAVLRISGPAPAYSGKVDLVWLSADKYRLTLSTPEFNQVHIVNAADIFEKNDGDYYPRWLQNFVEGLLDPVPVDLFRSGNGVRSSGDLAPTQGLSSEPCLSRDDRPGGITDQLTWGSVCFWPGPHLKSVLTFTRNLEFSDFHPFHDQEIAYSLQTSVLDYKPVTAHMEVLEDISADSTPLAIPQPTPSDGQIRTAFVSTLKEESLIDHPPVIDWPTVREGKTDGYMIVYARTDRTGQVRETAKHNSDNPGLEQFGMEQALRYKFRPLLIDGVAQQMEMPLVLHFTTKVADPLPYLSDAETRKQIHGCSLPHVKPGAATYRVVVSVNESGKFTGQSFPDANNPSVAPVTRLYSLHDCSFSPYLVKGKPTYYHGELILPR